MCRIFQTFGLSCLLIGLLSTGAALAQPGPSHHRGPHHGGPPLDRFVERHGDRLGLDEETRAAIDAIVERSRAEGEGLREEREAAYRELRSLLEQDMPDEAAVMRQADRTGEVGTRGRKHRLKTQLEIRALLTPEQRRQLVEIRKEEREKWRGRRAKREGLGRRGPPPPEDGVPIE